MNIGGQSAIARRMDPTAWFCHWYSVPVFHPHDLRVGVDSSLGRKSQNLFFSVDLLRLVVNAEDSLTLLFGRHALGSCHDGDFAVLMVLCNGCFDLSLPTFRTIEIDETRSENRESPVKGKRQ